VKRVIRVLYSQAPKYADSPHCTYVDIPSTKFNCSFRAYEFKSSIVVAYENSLLRYGEPVKEVDANAITRY